MDGGKYFIEFMLRQSDLPEELKNFREQMIKEVLGKYVREAKLKKALGEAIEEAKTETTSESATTPQK
jgi:predicted Holliday junction resolvase-like endonuclease